MAAASLHFIHIGNKSLIESGGENRITSNQIKELF